MLISKRKEIDYSNLKEVIFLAITEYDMFPGKINYKSEHVILDKGTHERDLSDSTFTFIELPKFKKDNVLDLQTYEEKWCYFFKHASHADDEAYLVQNSDEVIKRAYHELESHNWTREELRTYEAEEKSAKDAIAIMAAAVMDGEARGRAEGELKSKAAEKIEIAKNLIMQELDHEIIAKATGLTLEEISKL